MHKISDGNVVSLLRELSSYSQLVLFVFVLHVQNVFALAEYLRAIFLTLL